MIHVCRRGLPRVRVQARCEHSMPLMGVSSVSTATAVGHQHHYHQHPRKSRSRPHDRHGTCPRDGMGVILVATPSLLALARCVKYRNGCGCLGTNPLGSPGLQEVCGSGYYIAGARRQVAVGAVCLSIIKHLDSLLSACPWLMKVVEGEGVQGRAGHPTVVLQLKVAWLRLHGVTLLQTRLRRRHGGVKDRNRIHERLWSNDSWRL